MSNGPDIRNLLLLGPLPPEANGPSNLTVSAAAFVNASAHDYTPAAGAPQIDAGLPIAAVTTNRLGVHRPQGVAYDVGAHEWDDGDAGNTPPTITVTTPVDGASFVAPATITIAATASDADGSLREVAFSANGVVLHRDTTPPFSLALTNLPANSYALTATAVDNLGARTSTTVRVTVTPAAIALSARGFKTATGLQKAELTSTPEGSGSVAIYRNGQLLTTTRHDGRHIDAINRVGSGKYLQRCVRPRRRPFARIKVTVVF